MGYRLGYTGPEVDVLLQKANAATIINNGWEKLASTSVNPVNLDNLMTQGNYSISYWQNGPESMLTSGPINICVTKDATTTYQTIYESGKVYRRETTADSFSGGWIQQQNDTDIDIGASTPTNPCDNYIWIDTSGEVPIIKIYKENASAWIPVTADDLARASVYDPQGIQQPIDEYLNAKIEEANLEHAGEDFNNHLTAGESEGYPIHVTADEKDAWSNGISKTDAEPYITNMESELQTYADDQINNTSAIIDNLNTRVNEMNTKIAEHITDTSIHVTTADMTRWDNKADGDHIHNNNGSVTVSASNVVGLIPIERLDPSVLERNYTVSSYSEMMALTKNEVQNGDSIYINDTHPTAWFVIDDTKLGEEGVTATEGTISSTSRAWRSICYGNGKFVTITSSNNYFACSMDGITWTEGKISNTSRNWWSICYGNDKFVVVGTNHFAYSTDGINWTESTISSTGRSWRSVCYGNGKFVAVDDKSYFAYSTDGITWTLGTISSTSRYWISVCYGNGKFVTVARDTNYFAYSTDGITWTEKTLPSNRLWNSVCYGNGKFVTVASSNYFAYSTDGINWTESTISSTGRNWWSVCYDNGKYVAVARSSNYFAYSTDGINWTEGTISNTSRSWNSVSYGNNKFVTVAENTNYFANIIFTPPAGLIQYATPAKDLTWDNIENKPNTLAGYNITNCYTRDEINNLYNEIINSLTDIQTRATTLNDEVTVTIPDDFDTTITTNKEKSADINYKINLLIKNANMDTELPSTIYNLVNN